MSMYCIKNHFMTFEHFEMYDILGVITKPLSELNDATEKDSAQPDDIAQGDDSSSGEEQGGNSMTEEVKLLADCL